MHGRQTVGQFGGAEYPAMWVQLQIEAVSHFNITLH
jgi:hypothetical protein